MLHPVGAGPLSPIYTMKKLLQHATHDMSLRHATAMADLYYFVANPVQLVENTHDKPTPSLRPGLPMLQCMSRPMSQCMLSQKLNLQSVQKKLTRGSLSVVENVIYDA